GGGCEGRAGWVAEGPARTWPLPEPVAGEPAQVMRWAEVVTGLELEDGVIKPLAPAAWAERRRDLAAQGGPSAAPPDAVAWHRAEADDAAEAGEWFAALWHLR